MDIRRERSRVSTWATEFRAVLAKLTMPSLIIHGDRDKILPYESTAVPLHRRLAGAQLVTVAGGPHGIPWTHHEIVNDAPVKFLRA